MKIMWNHTLDEVVGDATGVTGMRVKSVQDGSVSQVDLSGVFIAIGHKPNTDIFAGQLDMKDGYITIYSGTQGNATATSVPGVFAAGDATTTPFKQIVIAAGEGSKASLAAFDYLMRVPAPEPALAVAA